MNTVSTYIASDVAVRTPVGDRLCCPSQGAGAEFSGHPEKPLKSAEAKGFEPLVTLGKTLAAIRDGEELSLSAFAVKLGTTAAKVSDIEHGRRHLGPRRAAEWARALGYSEAQFVRLALQEMVDDEGLDLEVRVAAR